jgi:hypothetical protein
MIQVEDIRRLIAWNKGQFEKWVRTQPEYSEDPNKPGVQLWDSYKDYLCHFMDL